MVGGKKKEKSQWINVFETKPITFRTSILDGHHDSVARRWTEQLTVEFERRDETSKRFLLNQNDKPQSDCSRVTNIQKHTCEQISTATQQGRREKATS